MTQATQIEQAAAALAQMAGAPRVRVNRAGLEKLMNAHAQRVNSRRQAADAEEANFRSLVSQMAGAEAWDRYSPLLGDKRPLAEMVRSRPIHARYDAAQTVDENRAHWIMADTMAADAANSHAVRAILRARARYEVANNCYAAGVGLTIANDFCGTGPRLNLTTDSETLNNQVEELFSAWCRAVNLPRLLRTMRMARRQDGEAFGLFISNPGVEDAVKLSIRLIEADQVQTFDLGLDSKRTDGIWFDDYGNPVKYDILREHPGSAHSLGAMEYEVWPRKLVLHWFRPLRPGQHRGVPELTPALGLYATLRRYTQATLDAAEAAADMAILLKTQAGAEFEDEDGTTQNPEAAEAFSTVPFARRMYVALPHGYDAEQFEAKQPTQQYSNFKREIAGEIGRCENVSRNVVLLDSSESNFASGQLDHKVTYRMHDIDRSDAEVELLDRIFRAWRDEAALISGYLPQPMRNKGPLPPHSWHWDSNELGDPLKLAKAKAASLAAGLTGLPSEYAAKGRDWYKALELTARGFGITVPELQKLIVSSVFSRPAEVSQVEEEEPEQKTAPKGASDE